MGTSQNLMVMKLDMLMRLAKAISMLSFVPNTFHFMIKSKSAKFIVEADYCSNAVTCIGVTVFVTFLVLFHVFDYFLR